MEELKRVVIFYFVCEVCVVSLKRTKKIKGHMKKKAREA